MEARWASLMATPRRPSLCQNEGRDEEVAPQQTFLNSAEFRSPPRLPLGEFSNAEERLQFILEFAVGAN